MLVDSQKVFAPVDEEYKKLRTGNTLGSNNSDKEAFLAMVVIGADQRALSFKEQCDRIMKESVILYTYQSISLVVAVVLFSLTFIVTIKISFFYFIKPIPISLSITRLLLHALHAEREGGKQSQVENCLL